MNIEDRQAQLDALCQQVFGNGAQASAGPDPDEIPARSVSLSDEELLAKAMRAINGEKFGALWEGHWEDLGYTSQSEADLAFMGMLAFWTGKDEARMVALFRKSGLMRKKAERDDYVFGMARKTVASAGGSYGAIGANEASPGLLGPGAPTSPWPQPLDEAAFHGPAGELVRAIEPHSEGDPAALLTDVLVAVGSIFGSDAHMLVEADKHPSRLFAVQVGETAKARKGTS